MLANADMDSKRTSGLHGTVVRALRGVLIFIMTADFGGVAAKTAATTAVFAAVFVVIGIVVDVVHVVGVVNVVVGAAS